RSLGIFERLGDEASLAKSYHQLGVLTLMRGEYGLAEEHCRRSLGVFERLGDEASLAKSYHQLGRLAQLRGAYGPAEVPYRRSLAIKERLGDHIGSAITQAQLGALYTAQGRPAEAIPFTLTALAFFAQAGTPEAEFCIHWLREQRRALGDLR